MGDARVRPFGHVQSSMIRCENDERAVPQPQGIEFREQQTDGVIEGLDQRGIDRFEGAGIFRDHPPVSWRLPIRDEVPWEWNQPGDR